MDIQLELIDQATGATLAESEAQLDSLPARFEGMDTRLTLGGQDWSVVSATPGTRDEIARAGHVRLVLARITMVDPRTILFSLPTLEDTLPSTVPAAEGEEVSIRIEPDDWRQVELVAATLRAEIDLEIADIRALKAAHRQGPGFDACHVRHRLPEPLGGARIPMSAIERAIGSRARPWALRGEPGVVRDGFAVPDAEGVVYGVARDGLVQVLAVHGFLDDVAGKLHPLARAQGLLLVQWCAAVCLRAVDEGFAE